METPVQAMPDAPKKSNTGLIIGIVVVVLLCCCCLLIAGVVAYTRYQAASTLSTINSQLSTPGTIPSVPGTGGGGIGGTGTVTNLPGIPSGGKGDDAQRSAAWAFVLTGAAMDSCSSTGTLKSDSTKISVTQQPDSSGAWKEEWTVTCDSGSAKTYVVAFPSGDANVANIKVTAK
jgi:hypothetical protein